MAAAATEAAANAVTVKVAVVAAASKGVVAAHAVVRSEAVLRVMVGRFL